MAYTTRAQTRALRELRPVLLVDSDGLQELSARATAFDCRALRRVGWFCAAVATLEFLVDPRMRASVAAPALRGPAVAWLLFGNALAGWTLGRMAFHELASTRWLSNIGRSLTAVDPWDLRPLAPFARRGLETVLIWAVGVSILSLFFLGGWASDLAPVVMGILVVVAGVALVLPVVGVHQSIVSEKRAELQRLDREVERGRKALLDSSGEARRDASLFLPAVLALRQQLVSTRDWPFDPSSLVRFILYIAIGLGSWLGSALVERLVGRFLS